MIAWKNDARSSVLMCVAVSIAVSFAIAISTSKAAKDKLPHTAMIQGRVLDEKKRPLSSAVVQLRGLSAERFPTITSEKQLLAATSARTNAQGRFKLLIRFGGDRPLTVKRIYAEHEGYVRKEATRRHVIAPGGQLDVELQLRRGDVISGRVDPIVWGLDAAAMWSNGATTFEYLKSFDSIHVTNQDFDQETDIRADGTFKLYVPPGTYTIAVGDKARLRSVHAGTQGILLQSPTTPITRERLRASFDALWSDMDRNYSYFAHKKIDWAKLREKYRPRVLECASVEHALVQFLCMLAELQDMHAWIEKDGATHSAYRRGWRRNWNPAVVERHLQDARQIGGFATVGTVRKDGFGYVAILRLSAQQRAVDELLDALAAKSASLGFIVDLRMCSGGDERIACRVAGHFCAQRCEYARHTYRNGPAHTDFGAESIRVLRPSKRPFTKPVVCLIGHRTMSSAEAFALMMQQLPHVTTVGATTRGASGNPQPISLPDLNVKVYYSRWIAMSAGSRIFEDVGIEPEIAVGRPIADYTADDPTFKKALSVLRAQIDD